MYIDEEIPERPQYTLHEIAELIGLPVETIRGLVRGFVALGCVEKVGERKTASGKGKPEHVYAFIDGFHYGLAKVLWRLEVDLVPGVSRLGPSR